MALVHSRFIPLGPRVSTPVPAASPVLTDSTSPCFAAVQISTAGAALETAGVVVAGLPVAGVVPLVAGESVPAESLQPASSSSDRQYRHATRCLIASSPKRLLTCGFIMRPSLSKC